MWEFLERQTIPSQALANDARMRKTTIDLYVRPFWAFRCVANETKYPQLHCHIVHHITVDDVVVVVVV